MSFLFGGNKGPTNIPEGRRERSKFRKAGEAVSYSPKIRDKDKREKLRRDLSDFDFTNTFSCHFLRRFRCKKFFAIFN